MKRALVVMVLFSVFSSLAAAQDQPKPGPETEKLKEMVGSWDASIKYMGGESKGTMTWKMGLGGLWLISDFKGAVGPIEFSGHGLSAWDPATNKYQSVWIDSMATSPLTMQGSYDAAGKVFTEIGSGKDPSGTEYKMKNVSTMKDKDTIEFKMYMIMGDKDMELMTIEYKRKK